MARASFDKGDKVRRWEKRLDDPEPALKQIGIIMVAESQEAFRNQRFGKDAWRERRVPNVFGIIADFHKGSPKPPQRRFEKRPALHDTDRLAGSISFSIVSRDTVEAGSNLPYAGKHHRGTETESEPITAQVRRLLWAWLKGPGKQWKRALGWLLNRKFRDVRLTMQLPERRIVGITKQTMRDVKEAVGVKIMEVK